MSENPSPLTRSGGQTPELEAVVAQLRHAYQQLIAHDERWSRRGMQQFADGLIAPQIRKLERILAAVCRETPQWRPIASAPKDGTQVLLRAPIDNGSDPKYQTVVGFYAPTGTLDMDGDTDESLVDESGMNIEDGWVEVSASREPWAWLMNYKPTHWHPIPAPPAGGE